MANGDIAAAAGLPVVAPTADIRLGYDEINKTRDQLVQRTPATYANAAKVGGRTIYVQSSAPAGAADGDIWLET